MPREQTSPWSDWSPIHLPGCIWRSGAGFATPPTTALAADQLSGSAAQLNPGGESPKVTISATTGFYGTGAVAGYFYQLPVPDYCIDKQPARLAGWDGDNTVDMDFPALPNAILIENVLVAITAQEVVAADLLNFEASVKFRGYGRDADGPSPTQDTPVAPDGAIFTNAGSVFGDMAFPSVAPNGQNAAVTFGGDASGIARIQTLVFLPTTLAMGDVIEMGFAFEFDIAETTPIQWYSAKYRFCQPPFSIFANGSVQCMGQDTDAAGDPMRFQLESQSRLDDLTYEP